MTAVLGETPPDPVLLYFDDSEAWQNIYSGR